MRETDRATYEKKIADLERKVQKVEYDVIKRETFIDNIQRQTRSLRHDLQSLQIYTSKTEEVLRETAGDKARDLFEARPLLVSEGGVQVHPTAPGGLGRLMSPDPRDTRFTVPYQVPQIIDRDRDFRYWWTGGWWGDQGFTPQCVAYAWLHLLEDGPITQEPRTPGVGPVYDPYILYRRSQDNDEWYGSNYDGTSVRAGAKVLQRLGYISAYHWIFNLGDLIYHVLEKGPVVAGTWWYEGMNKPSAENGFLLTPTGQALGGHAYVINGVNVEKEIFRIKNSWGRQWGNQGMAYVNFDDMIDLMYGGEFCFPVEILNATLREEQVA